MRPKALIAAWWLPVAILAVGAALLLPAGESLVNLRYDRAAIATGEFWRLLTGHWVHLGGRHYAMNAMGLLLVWYLVGNTLGGRQWLLVIASSVLAMDAGFWLLMPALDWYVGLSGLLHGLLAAGAVTLWRGRRAESLAIGAILVVKLAYEILFGAIPGSTATAGGAVITEAHLFGAIGGFVASLLISRRVGPLSPI
jgi:rhomboid family GlyGly-CTERM serine protease